MLKNHFLIFTGLRGHLTAMCAVSSQIKHFLELLKGAVGPRGWNCLVLEGQLKETCPLRPHVKQETPGDFMAGLASFVLPRFDLLFLRESESEEGAESELEEWFLL